MFHLLKAEIDLYVKDKTWYWYIPFWLLGLYLFVKVLGFELGANDVPFLVNIPQSFNFMLHEIAHLMLAFAPSLITASAGSGSELLLGALLIWGGFKGRTYFASMFGFLWFMLACQATADYMADARTQNLPLVSFGDVSGSGAIHDWNFVFGKLGLLEMDTFIAGMVRTVGVLAGLFGLLFAAWLMYRIAGATEQKALTKKEAALLHQTASDAGLHAAPPKHFENLKEGSLYPTPIKGRLSEEPKKPVPADNNRPDANSPLTP